MKHIQIISLGLISFSLAACNSGSSSSSDVQTSSINNGTANISITATGCRTITANGGTCTIAVTYSAPSGSIALDNLIGMSPLTNYSNNLTGSNPQCTSPFTVKSQNCTITITSQSSTSDALQAQIYPSNQPNTAVSFTVGGGL